MATTIPDLWPDSFGEPGEPTPAAILRQQAIILGKKTENLVYGEVQSRAVRGGTGFAHQFDVVAPLLAFRRPLVITYHSVSPYPAVIGRPDLNAPLNLRGDFRAPTNHLGEPTLVDQRTVNSAAEFMDALKQILQAEGTRELIQTLIAQCIEPESVQS